MPDPYITIDDLKTATPGDDASSVDAAWTVLAEAVSRQFDRECEVEDGFFGDNAATETRTFYTDGTRYLKIGQYTPDSITSIVLDTVDYYDDFVSARKYREREGYLIFNFDIEEDQIITVNAEFGFSAVPSEVKQACIEQGLAMFRRKDMSFADLSGVSGAAITAEYTPTFKAVTDRYRALYSQRNFFA